MNAGEMNRRVTFLKKTVTYNALNEPVEAWAEAFTTWAAVMTTGGREFYAAQRLNNETSVLFKVRFTKAAMDEMRIRYGNKEFDIITINDVNGAHTELHISAKEVVS